METDVFQLPDAYEADETRAARNDLSHFFLESTAFHPTVSMSAANQIHCTPKDLHKGCSELAKRIPTIIPLFNGKYNTIPRPLHRDFKGIGILYELGNQYYVIVVSTLAVNLVSSDNPKRKDSSTTTDSSKSTTNTISTRCPKSTNFKVPQRPTFIGWVDKRRIGHYLRLEWVALRKRHFGMKGSFGMSISPYCSHGWTHHDATIQELRIKVANLAAAYTEKRHADYQRGKPVPVEKLVRSTLHADFSFLINHNLQRLKLREQLHTHLAQNAADEFMVFDAED